MVLITLLMKAETLILVSAFLSRESCRVAAFDTGERLPLHPAVKDIFQQTKLMG
jgi:hypothetical protein